MKIAFLFMAHHLPDQLFRLIKTLQFSDFYFYIHVDLKSDINQFKHISSIPQVNLISGRKKVYWGKISQVEAELNLLNTAIHSDADRYIMLSGVDYPIVSNEKILAFFENNQHEYLSYSFLGPGGWEAAAIRYQRYYVEQPVIQKCIELASKFIPNRKMPNHFRPFGGATWWNLTRDCCEYLLDYENNHPEVMKFFSTTLCPDEMFFQTILLNSPFCERIVNNDLRYIDWSDCASGKSNSPNILTVNDFYRINNSGKLFARKFDATVDSKILDMIDHIR
jgi:hypothetical protein